MIQVYLKNVQSIREYTFNFPETGIVQFSGDNNNGKSIFTKVLAKCVLQQLVYDDKRLPLINDKEKVAMLSISYNKKCLVVQIHQDVNQTFYGLVRDGGEKIVRYVREGGITEILREFGFVVFSKNLICLQMCETFGLMPFINTPDTLNGEIVNSVTTDIPSEVFINNYQLTFKEAKRRVNTYKAEIERLESQASSIVIKDTTKYNDLIQRGKELQRKASYLKKCNLITIEPFPVIEFKIKKVPMLRQLPVIVKLDKMKPLYNMDGLFADLLKIKEGKCPTCGKPFLDGRCRAC